LSCKTFPWRPTGISIDVLETQRQTIGLQECSPQREVLEDSRNISSARRTFVKACARRI